MPLFFRFLILAALCCTGTVGYGQDDISEDVRMKFLSVDQSGTAQVVDDPASANSIGIFLYGYEDFLNLRLINRQAFDVWINGRMFFSGRFDLVLPKQEIFRMANSDTAYVSLHARNAFSELDARIYYDELEPIALVYPIGTRQAKSHQSMMITATIVFGIVLGVFRIVTSAGLNIQGLLRSTGMFRSHDVNTRELTPVKFIETLLGAVLIGFAMWFLFGFDQEATLVRSLLTWAQYIFIIGIGLFAKYFFIRAISALYGLSQISVQQFTDFVRVTLLSAIALTVIFLAAYWFGFYKEVSFGVVWKYYFLFVQLAFLIYFFLRVTVGTTVKKLSIFSYLCTTEILGAFIVALIFTK